MSGTDDTAFRNQLLEAIFASGGYPTVDHFAKTFLDSAGRNLKLWFIPVGNAYFKYKEGLTLPAYAGWGNMQSSSSAMAIAPMGIINACNPKQAALETMEIASFIHNGETGFCRDAACAMAAAVTAAFKPETTMEKVIESARTEILPISGHEMAGLISEALEIARRTGSYEEFREEYYDKYLRTILCDSQETIPAVFAILLLSKGDPKQSIIWGANFGRDSDTIATMVGGV